MKSIHIRSAKTIEEMKTFVQTDEPGKQGFGAEGSKKDDRVMGLALAVEGMGQVPRQKIPKPIAQQHLEELKKQHHEQIPGSKFRVNPERRQYRIRGVVDFRRK